MIYTIEVTIQDGPDAKEYALRYEADNMEDFERAARVLIGATRYTAGMLTSNIPKGVER